MLPVYPWRGRLCGYWCKCFVRCYECNSGQWDFCITAVCSVTSVMLSCKTSMYCCVQCYQCIPVRSAGLLCNCCVQFYTCNSCLGDSCLAVERSVTHVTLAWGPLCNCCMQCYKCNSGLGDSSVTFVSSITNITLAWEVLV